jgi:predicted ATPase
LASEKGAVFWKAQGTLNLGSISALTGETADAIEKLTSGVTGVRSTGASRHWIALSDLAGAYAEIGQFDDAWRCIDEAVMLIEKTKERLHEADVNRVAGEIALKSSPESDTAEAYFERALSVARAQQAKSWELRAAMSMARLWRDQGKRDEARELLTPVYGWFTEGFDTLDLKEAKSLLNALAS